MLKLWKNKSSNYGRGVYFVDTDSKEDSSLFRLPVHKGVVVSVVEDHRPSGVAYSVRVRYKHVSYETVVPVEHAWGNFSVYMTEALGWLRQRRMELARRLDGFNHTACYAVQDYENVMYFRDRIRDNVQIDMRELDKLVKQLYEIEKLSEQEQATLCYRLKSYGNRVIGWANSVGKRLEDGKLPSKPELERELEIVEKLIASYSRKLTKAAGRKLKNIGPRRP
jgi:hypothetical protein